RDVQVQAEASLERRRRRAWRRWRGRRWRESRGRGRRGREGCRRGSRPSPARGGWGGGAAGYPPPGNSVVDSPCFISVLYIVAFSLFIQGLRGLAGPTTAVRGNRTAAVGMAIAVIATLLAPGEGNWGLIALGLALGIAVGVPAARNVRMTAMPQM